MYATNFLHFGDMARKPMKQRKQRKQRLAFGALFSAALIMFLGMVIEAQASPRDVIYTVPRQSLIMDEVGSGDKLYLNVAIQLKEDGKYSLQGKGFENELTITPPPAGSETYPTYVSKTGDDSLQPKLDGTLTIPSLLAIGRGDTVRGVILDNCQVEFSPNGKFTSSGCTERGKAEPATKEADIATQEEIATRQVAANCNQVAITASFYESIEASLVGKTAAEVDAIIGCTGKDTLETLGVITRSYVSVPSESTVFVFFSGGRSFDSDYEVTL